MDLRKQPVRALALGAIGVVYGDIGTSPLYTMHEIFAGSGGVALTPRQHHRRGVDDLLGADDRRLAQVRDPDPARRQPRRGRHHGAARAGRRVPSVPSRRLRRLLLIAGVFGAALFYGDGVITPAISVLSAVEGLEVATPALKTFVVPMTVVVLVVLFVVQRKGTAGIGNVFGPIMLVWFAVLAVAGLISIAAAPQVLVALNPLLGARLPAAPTAGVRSSRSARSCWRSPAPRRCTPTWATSAPPIRVAWFGLVLPALALNYLGQGALLIADPEAIENPFFRLFPSWVLFPMVVLRPWPP